MELKFLLKGILIGFAIAAPVGPIGILCIRRTLQFGRFSGLFSGLGAAVADSIYGIISAFGLTLISNFLISQQFWLRLVGGTFLIYLGIKTSVSKPAVTVQTVTHKTFIGDFISTFFLTISNPMTIFSFIGIFAGLGLASSSNDEISATWLVIGVFVGSALWWLALSEGITLFRKKVSQNVMLWINRLAGVIIIAFGIVAWLSLVFV